MSFNKVHPSSLPLDMAQFNSITEGKSTYQEELLELFFQNSAECILLMDRNCANNDNNENWHDALEELKNISSSIGAMELSKVCAVAERISNASEEEKRKILASIRLHLQRLRAFVRNTRY